MSRKRIILITAILFAAAGLVCIALCIFREGENQWLLAFGLLCNSIASLLYCLEKRKK